MALPNSGPISLANVQTEFGGSNPISLSEYYSAASGVPSSGTIRLSDFYGTSSLPPIVSEGLQLFIDPGNTNSYPGSGTLVKDLSPAGNDGVLTSTVTHDPNTNGGIFTFSNYDFNGPVGYISLGTTPTNMVGLTNNFTIQAYIRFPFVNAPKSIYAVRSSLGSGGNPNDFRVDLTTLKWYTNKTDNSSGYQTCNGPNLSTADTWFNVAVTVSSPSPNCTVKFYKNGALTTTTSCNRPGAAAPDIDHRIGANSTDSSKFIGNMGVILFYNKVLSETEISENYDVFKSRYGLT